MPRPSSIDKLPPDILAQLQELLRDPRVSQLDVTARINELLETEGHEERVSKSAVNRYAVRMSEAGEKLRQSRAVAEMWIGKLGAAPQGQIGHLVNEILRTMAFELSLKLQETELDAESIPAIIEQLKALSLSVVRLETAATQNVKREDDIRRQEREKALEAAAARVDNAAQARGLTAEDARFWREQVLMGM